MPNPAPSFAPMEKVGASVVEAHSRRTLCVCVGDTAEADAHARLFAAAPDLLRELRYLRDSYVRGCLGNGMSAALDRIEDTIAKAEGR